MYLYAASYVDHLRLSSWVPPREPSTSDLQPSDRAAFEWLRRRSPGFHTLRSQSYGLYKVINVKSAYKKPATKEHPVIRNRFSFPNL